VSLGDRGASPPGTKRERLKATGRERRGRLTVDICQVLAFERAHEGLAILASGKTRGKLVVNIVVAFGG
jgi:hypothetical protein